MKKHSSKTIEPHAVAKVSEFRKYNDQQRKEENYSKPESLKLKFYAASLLKLLKLSIFWPPQSKLALVPQASSVDSDVDSIIAAKKTQIKQNLSLRETGEVAN